VYLCSSNKGMIAKIQNRQSEAREKQTAVNMPNLSLYQSDAPMHRKKNTDEGILISFLIKSIIGLNNKMGKWMKSTPMGQYLLANFLIPVTLMVSYFH